MIIECAFYSTVLKFFHSRQKIGLLFFGQDIGYAFQIYMKIFKIFLSVQSHAMWKKVFLLGIGQILHKFILRKRGKNRFLDYRKL